MLFRSITDGTSNTAGASERLLGTGDENSTLANRSLLKPQTMYVNPGGEPTDSSCGASLRTNSNQRRMYTWVAGEPRCTSYNHYYLPNDKVNADCISNFTGSGTDPLAYATGHGLSTARSQHTGLVTVWFCDGSVRTISDSVQPTVWRAIATRRGGEIVSPDD